MSIQLTAGEARPVPQDQYLFGPRAAWFAYAMTLGLMIMASGLTSMATASNAFAEQLHKQVAHSMSQPYAPATAPALEPPAATASKPAPAQPMLWPYILGSAFIRRTASQPSSTGRLRSIRTRSGRSVRASSRPPAPSTASST